MNTFKVLGLLMSYPKPEWIAHLDECELLLQQENFLPKKHLHAVEAFIDRLKTSDIFSVQEEYVSTFDRGRSHSLHLFEHIHGESRDRGQAMVNLSDAYEEKGLFIDKAELPDFIPLFLEFLSLCPVDEAIALLGEPIDIMATIATRLKKRDSSYAVLFNALVALSKVKPSEEIIQEVLDQELEDTSLEAMDREWEEAAAFAGQPDQSDCGACTAPDDGLQIKITR
ncbi:MAG: nitrate reductase molybdenum cofactor assembly chaperone [Xanthomonadales bacterium]|jgi:nitrate reductase delta subunit|nr:nitrate reductase molybdenum cofactor assembly chaperone [Xanthomonadales bacterium]MDH4020019.1 nitrate reductase molybdenum cofactor assembly chaperone [Xanthomonadales bacterium]